MKKYISIISIIAFIAAIAFVACNKDDDDDNNNNNNNNTSDTTFSAYDQAAIDEATMSEAIYHDVVVQVVSKDEGSNKLTCPTVTGSPLVGYPKVLTIDFGTTGCDIGGYTVTGKIIADISAKLRTAGSTATITFDNYKVDTITVNGTVALTINSAELSTGTANLTQVIDGSLTTTSGTITLSSTQTIDWALNSTTNSTDDIFTISNGSSLYTGIDGSAFSSTITSPLILKSECIEIVDGTIVLSTDATFDSTIDFGDGTCDGVATVTTFVEFDYLGTTWDGTYSYEVPLP